MVSCAVLSVVFGFFFFFPLFYGNDSLFDYSSHLACQMEFYSPQYGGDHGFDDNAATMAKIRMRRVDDHE